MPGIFSNVMFESNGPQPFKKKCSMNNTILTFVAIVAFATTLHADEISQQRDQNWHQWRGPLANGVAPHGDPPAKWGEETNIRWKVAVEGRGSSTPIIWGDQLFLLSAIRTDRIAENPPQRDARAKTQPPPNLYKFEIICVDRKTGKTRWQQTACEDVPHEGRHHTNTFASSSPMTDGERLYVSFGSRGTYCYDLNGKLIWKRDLGNMRTRYGWGEATSPVVHGESLVINWDHEDQSFIAVLDAVTGETRWTADRDEPTSWSTPLVVEHQDRVQVIVNATNRVRSYDLKTGDIIWQCGGQTLNTIPSPVATKDFVVCMSFYGNSMACAIPFASKGDVTNTDQILWSYRRGTPYVPSPLLVNNRLYFTQGNNAVLSCLNVENGKRLFGPVRLPTISSLYASPSSAAGCVYFVGRDGKAVVIEDGDEFKVMATNQLAERIDASPAIVGQELFLRGEKHLYCISEETRD